jgi:hypothetical protein
MLACCLGQAPLRESLKIQKARCPSLATQAVVLESVRNREDAPLRQGETRAFAS